MIVPMLEKPDCNVCGRKRKKLVVSIESPPERPQRHQKPLDKNKLSDREGRIIRMRAEHNYPWWLKQPVKMRGNML